MNDPTPTPPRMTDQAPELLPCPFCGNAAKIRCHDDDEATIMCANNACRLVVGVPATKRAIAIKNWNTRPTPAERPVPQVREALEQIERESDPERPGAYISAGERLATIRRIVCALLSARPSDALTGADAWDNLVNKDDRTSPEEYPDMALITREELIGYIQRSGGERPSDAAVAKEEAAHLHTIDQRDEAEGCVRNVYFKIIGRSPEWSNNFGYAEALEEIEEAVFLLKAAAKPLALPPDEPARVNELRSQLVKANGLLRMMLTDPEPTLAREPDTDGEVIFKFRRMVCDHLGLPYGSQALPDEDLPTANDVRGILAHPDD